MKQSRQKLLLPFRNRLTDSFYDLKEAVAFLENLRLETSPEDVERVKRLTEVIGFKELNQEQQALCVKMSALGRLAASKVMPIFGGFTDWVLEEAIKIGVNEIWFSGRDSKPMMDLAMADSKWKSSGIEFVWHPFCRGNIFNCYSLPYSPRGAAIESNHVINYYNSLNLENKKAIVVDFGFFGTLERAHRLMLLDRELPANYLAGHRVFLKLPKNVQDITIFDKGISSNIFDSKKFETLVQIELEYSKKVKGYYDPAVESKYQFMLGSGRTYSTVDLRFIIWLQESGSGLRDSVFDLGKFDNPEYLNSLNYRLGSLQQYCYWDAFSNVNFEVRHDNDKNSIDDLYSWYKANETILRETITVDQRDFCKIKPHFNHIVDESNRVMIENGYQTTTLVGSEV